MAQAALTIDSVISRSTTPLATEVDGEMVMMNMDSGEYYGLDAIATEIWKRIEQPMRVGDLAADLHKRYEAPLDTITADLLRLLGAMLEKQLITAQP